MESKAARVASFRSRFRPRFAADRIHFFCGDFIMIEASFVPWSMLMLDKLVTEVLEVAWRSDAPVVVS